MNSRSLARPEHDCQIASASFYSGKALNGPSPFTLTFNLDSPLVTVLEMCRSNWSSGKRVRTSETNQREPSIHKCFEVYLNC